MYSIVEVLGLLVGVFVWGMAVGVMIGVPLAKAIDKPPTGDR